MNGWLLRLRPRSRDGDAPRAVPLDGNGAVPTLRARPDAPPSSLPPRRRALLRPPALVGLALALLALLGYWSAYTRAGQRSPMLVAARDLPAGTLLEPGDLTTANLAGDRAVLSTLVPKAQLEAVLGRRLATSVPAGVPLARAVFAGQARPPASFTLTVAALHALAGALVPGDRVSVLATFATAAGQAQTRAIARGLEVLAVGRAPSGLDQASATVAVTVALPSPSLASALALANSAAKIDLLREGGSGNSAPIPTVSETAP